MASESETRAKIDPETFVVCISVFLSPIILFNGAILGCDVERDRSVTILSCFSSLYSREIFSKDLRRRRSCSDSMASVLC